MGWEVDDAAVRAMEAVASRSDRTFENLVEDRAAVIAAVRAIYGPWLQRQAQTLQHLLRDGVPSGPGGTACDAVLFIDGLRMDLAHRLVTLLRDSVAHVDVSWRWTGYPTVTATCKPLASPAAERFKGADAANTFEPVAADGRRVVQAVLLRELAALNWKADVTLVPSDRCWLETGHFDKDGHDKQSRMLDYIAADLRVVASEALRLVQGGRRLRITTDHGWLLLPGGLPVANLPPGTTETKWSRCAVVQEGAATSAIQLPWTWNPSVHVATAPGIHVFRGGLDYAHGGISPQECVVPELLVFPLAVSQRATIGSMEWVGLRLRIRAAGGDGLMADLRLGADGEGVSIVDRPRELDADGRTSLLVPDDSWVGRPARLELRDSNDRVVAQQATVVGG